MTMSNLMAQLKDKGKLFTDEVHLKKDDPNYGRPLEGTKTAARGRKAHEHVSKEIIELCEIIWTHGQIRGYSTEDETMIMFGELFQLYTRISNKVVGLLLRARKYKLVEFEGETLFQYEQGQNDNTPIFLVRPLPEIRVMFKTGADPKNFEWGKLATSEQSTNNPPESTSQKDAASEKSAKKVKVKKKKSLAPQPPCLDNNTVKVECDLKENKDANAINESEKNDKTNNLSTLDKDTKCDDKSQESNTVSITYLSLLESEKECSQEETNSTSDVQRKESIV